MQTPEEFLKQANIAQALQALTEQIRAKPADGKLRVFLAQLLCVTGDWQRALNQMSVAAELDPLAIPMKQVYGDAIKCEALRADVFSGKRSPMVFGQPDEWLALLIESLSQRATGGVALAASLHAQAFEAAPAIAGKVNGIEFDWFADADMRLGPVLEAYINGKYYWVPFSRLARIQIETPEDLRDCVWTPSQLQFENGGEAPALIPTRYQGADHTIDPELLLSRKTQWTELEGEFWQGTGQRIFSSSAGEHSIMDIREVRFTPAVT